MSIEIVRAEQFARLSSQPLDVLVIGGGIVGAGVARDAAMRGLRTGLVEKHDLAFGTSGRSSRLLHGGLRYLAQGRLGLVWAANREKMTLHRIAPHLAEPLAFLFPTYRGTPWPRWQLRIGVKLYDLLCGRRNLGRSATLGQSEVKKLLPGIRSNDLTGAVRYFDGLTNDARLVLDTLSSARRYGANIINYTAFEEAHRDGPAWRCAACDAFTGQRHLLTTRSIVNAAGPWAAGLPQSRLRLRLTKGVHLVVDRKRLPLPSAVVMTERSRILFGIPWGERVILGTTDTDYEGPPESVAVNAADIEYILNVVNASFPSASLNSSDVMHTWAGLRPLLAAGHGGPSDISRAHRIDMPEPGWFDVAGGKLTTYRLIAEHVVDRLARQLRRKLPRCRTGDEPLLAFGESTGESTPSGIVPPPVRADVVEHFCRREWAVHLDDVMIRRTSWHYYRADADAIAPQVADWMASFFGWDAPQKEAELTRYLHH